jgi:hypothetical protein
VRLVTLKPLRIQRAAMFAASNVPIATRVEQWIGGAVRGITAKRPDISATWARAAVLKRPPAWVRDYLESLETPSIVNVQGDDHAAA